MLDIVYVVSVTWCAHTWVGCGQGLRKLGVRELNYRMVFVACSVQLFDQIGMRGSWVAK